MIIDMKTRQEIQPSRHIDEMLTAFIGIAKAPLDAMMLREAADVDYRADLAEIRRLRDEADEALVKQ